MSEVFREIKESLTMRQVAEHFGYPVNRSGFIFSPFGKEKTASCKLYFDTGSFYDFSTNFGGDIIRFTAAILNINNWEACQYLIQAFSLPMSLSGSTDHQEEIERRQRERQRQEERKQEFMEALWGEINRLKHWEDICRLAIEKQLFEPFSDMWGCCINELQETEYKLDILCGSDQNAYRRMKPNVAAGLSSDRPQWLLDTLSILAEGGAFQATQSELKEIRAQRDFEVLERQPGKDRECDIEWVQGVLRNKYEPQEKRGEARRRREQEDLQQMSDSGLIMLLESLTAEG